MVQFAFHRPQKVACFVFAQFEIGIARQPEQNTASAFSYSETDAAHLPRLVRPTTQNAFLLR